MKNDTINYVMVGSFVVAMIAGLLFAIALLTGRTGATDTYYTRYDDATGLKYGSQVLYMGFPVGQVEDVTPVVQDGKVVFELELSVSEAVREWQVPADSVAEVRAAGLLAAITIDIRAGSSEESLKPGARLRGRGRADVFGAVQETASTLRDLTETSVRPLLENLNRHVSSFGEVLDERGGPLLSSLGVLSQELSKRAPEIIDDFLQTTADLRKVSERVSLVFSEGNTDKVGAVVDQLLLASENMAGLTGDARGQLDALLGAAMVSRVERLLDDAGASASEVLALTRGSRERLERLLSEANLARVESSLTNVEQATAGLEQLAGDGNRALVTQALTDLRSSSAALRTLTGQDTLDSVRSTLTATQQGAEALSGLARGAQERLDGLLDEAAMARLARLLSETSVTRVESSLANVERATADLRGFTGAENQDTLRAALTDLRAASAALKDLVGPGTQASVTASLDSVRAASATLEGLIGDARGNVEALIGPATRAKLDRTLDNVSQASSNIAALSTALDARLGEVLTPAMSAKLAAAMTNFSTAAGNVAALTQGLQQSRERLDRLLETVDDVATENRSDLRGSVRDLRHALRTVSQHVDAVATNLEGTSRNMFEFSRRLKANPGLLLRTPAGEADRRRARGVSR